MATPVVASVASATTTRNSSRRSKRRFRKSKHSSSLSSCLPSELPSAPSNISGRSRSPSLSHGSHSNAKNSPLNRPHSAIANPSSSAGYLPSANTSAINCRSNHARCCMHAQGCPLVFLQNNGIKRIKKEKMPLGICVRNLPLESTDTSLNDQLFHEYKKHGHVTMVEVIGQGTERYAVVVFKKTEDVDKALQVSKDKLLLGCKLEVTAYEGLDAADNDQPVEEPLEEPQEDEELDEFHLKATRTLFIGNLERHITIAQLREHFDQFGEIIEIDIKKPGSTLAYAFIQYSDIASVVKAMRILDGKYMGANRMKLAFGKSRRTNCVWLDGIVECISNKFLVRHFNRFGFVVYSAVDRERGQALIFYESVDVAQMAVAKIRGRTLLGQKLQVDFASIECQLTFFCKVENSEQMNSADGTQN